MSEFQDEIKKSLDVLKFGGIILYPTDTIWGLGCDATNPEAVKRIFELKKRDGLGIWNTTELSLKATSQGAEILLMEVPMAI